MSTKKSIKKSIKKPLLNEILPHPELPPIKFRIGQTVWQAGTNWTGKNITCKACNGKRNVTASIPNSNKVITSSCPECYGAGYINGDWRYYPNVVLLTICSIRVDTIISSSSTDIVAYMMHQLPND